MIGAALYSDRQKAQVDSNFRQSRSRHENRGKVDIIADILHLCMTDVRKKTEIMQTANLSTRMTSTYLEVLLKRDLVRHEQTRHRRRGHYRITEKGIMFLKWYSRIKSLVNGD